MMKRKGFTIIELMMVIAIISVLITITVTAILGSMERARNQKARALRTLVEQGLATYYAQEGTWPGNFSQDKTDSNSDTYKLSESEVNDVILDMVKKTREYSPVMDVTGLYVSRDGKYGTDFMTAVRGTKHAKQMSVSQMKFGYPKSDGTFAHFTMHYSPVTDKLSVSL